MSASLQQFHTQRCCVCMHSHAWCSRPCHARAGWFGAAQITRAYSRAAQGGRVGPAAAVAAATWAIGTPTALVLRGLSKGYAPPKPFIVVSFVATGVLMIGWRSVFAAFTKPEVRPTSPAHATLATHSVNASSA